MAGKDEKTKQTKPKKQSTIKQIITIFKYTHKEDKMLPALIAGAFLVPVIVFVILGIIFRWTVLTWVFLMLIAIMLGMLLSTIVLTRRADMVGYKQLDGKTGAAISVLRNINKAGFNFPEQPVWVDPRTKDAIWRGTGYNGIYLLGEGDYDRVKRAMDRQEQSIKSVTAGSQIPVYRVMVGNGQGQVPLKKLRSNIIRRKAYRPTHHKNALLAKIHPRERFILTKAELEKLNARLRTLQTKNGMGIPKGITLIVGGGYHGKSTLLKALELGVYDHIAGDGREYVITDRTAVKIRAEDGRSIRNTDISMFINNLPNKKDTHAFYSEDASGSTSQAAGVVEAMEAGTSLLLMDEDTSATNFMIRDELMQRVIHRDMEPITPFLDRIRELYGIHGISTVIVAGSSGAFFHAADRIPLRLA